MLKLTRFDDPARDVWIPAKAIVGLTDDHESTFVWTAPFVHRVKETLEQIMAMPEMLYEMYPAMVINQGSLKPMNVGSNQHPCYVVP